MQITYDSEGVAVSVALTAEEERILERELLPRKMGFEAFCLEVINRINGQGGDGEAVLREKLDNIAAAKPPRDYRDKRAERYVIELSDGEPTFDQAVGDMSDATQKKLRKLEAAILALDPTADVAEPDFDGKVAKIDQIKISIPKRP